MVKVILAVVVVLLPVAGICAAAIAKSDEMARGRERLAKAADIKRDVVFKEVDGIKLLMDFFVPKDKKQQKYPTVIFVHGGGWYSNTKDEIYADRFVGVVERLMEEGVAVVSFDYRLVALTNTHGRPKSERHLISSEHTYEKITADCKDVVRWLYKNGDKYGIDSARMATWGGSAGGHLSLMMGLTKDDEFVGDVELAGQKSNVKCIVSWYGTTDFAGQFEFMKKRRGGPVKPLLGGTPEEKRQAYKEASPINYLKKESVPILLCHGTLDPVVPYNQSVLLNEKGEKIGADIEMVTVAKSGHNFAPRGDIKPTLEEIQDLTVGFILKRLAVKGP